MSKLQGPAGKRVRGQNCPPHNSQHHRYSRYHRVMRVLRSFCVFLAACFCVWPQARVSADQVVSFIQDAIHRKQDDGAVAKQVSMLKLSTRLDSDAVSALQHSGAGPKTVAALTRLAADSAKLPAGAPTAPKAAAAEPPPPSPEEWKHIVDSIRETALAYT